MTAGRYMGTVHGIQHQRFYTDLYDTEWTIVKPVPCAKCVWRQHSYYQRPARVRFPLRASQLGTVPATIDSMIFFFLAHIWSLLLGLSWVTVAPTMTKISISCFSNCASSSASTPYTLSVLPGGEKLGLAVPRFAALKAFFTQSAFLWPVHPESRFELEHSKRHPMQLTSDCCTAQR